jgi:hypothetical protein
MVPNFSRKQILLFGLALLTVGLLANEWLLTALFSADGQLSSRSVILIWLFDVTAIILGVVLILSRSLVTLLNFIIGVGFTILLIIGLERVVIYRLNHAPPPAHTATVPEAPPPPPTFEGSYTENFFQDDSLLGYKPQPNTQVNSIKRQGDEILYSVTYSIDQHSRRVTPQPDEDSRSKFMLLFGDSFTFGEGVNDDDTLAYHLAQLAPGYRVYNYGFSGYGPQQMLAFLQQPSFPAPISEATGVGIYVFIDGHVERAIGSMYVYNAWGADMPYYTLNWRGQLERKGSFRSGRPIVSTLYSWLGETEFARYFNLNIPGTLQSGHFWLTARIIAEARDEFKKQYPDSKFYVVIYPDEGDYYEDIAPYFAEFQLTVLNYDEWLKLDAETGTAIKGDGHPTGAAHKQVAEWITQDLGINQ